MRAPRLLLVLLATSFTSLACSDSDDGGTTDPPPEDVSFSQDIQPIFTANCALSGCHSGTNPQQGMNLSSGQAYANIVNVASLELPSMDRIEPSDPDNSYLVNKIQGTHVDVGGSGSRMPLGRAPLTQATIDQIREWVADGAPDN